VTRDRLRIRIVAPSSVVPQAELKLGVSELRAQGFHVEVDPQVKKKDLFFAGSTDERVEALVQAAYSDAVDVIWCARGGYGANHLLEPLRQVLMERGIPARKKLLVGSSDASSLLEFARVRWRFSALHAPMPGLKKFVLLSPQEKAAAYSWMRGARPEQPWGKLKALKWWGEAPREKISGTVVGGNLTVWNTLLGTRFQPDHQESSILFLEDVTETLPRLDRALRHLVDAGGLKNIRAIVLGNFLDCEDAVPQVLGQLPQKLTPASLKKPSPRLLRPLRKKFTQIDGLRRIFEPISEELGIPVAWGLPVGHGPEQFSLPLGGRLELTPAGQVEISQWDWL
jgi:muramoyltetrapeptide carboxypeptidase